MSVGFGSGLLMISKAVKTKPPMKIEAGNKIFLLYAIIELFKNNKDKETVVVPTPQPAMNPTPAPTYVSNDPVVPEVDEIPF